VKKRGKRGVRVHLIIASSGEPLRAFKGYVL